MAEAKTAKKSKSAPRTTNRSSSSRSNSSRTNTRTNTRTRTNNRTNNGTNNRSNKTRTSSRSSNRDNSVNARHPTSETSDLVEQSGIRAEIYGVIIAAVCLIIILSLFTDAIGPFGGFIKDLLLGLIGFAGYLLPFVILAMCVGSFFVRSEMFGAPEYFIAASLLVIVISIAHVVGPVMEYSDIVEFFVAAYQKGGTGGGVIGAAFGEMFSSIIGQIGAVIVFVATAIVLIMVLTGRSLTAIFGSIRAGARNVISRREVQADDEYYDDELEDDTPFTEPVVKVGGRRQAKLSDHTIEPDQDNGSPIELSGNKLRQMPEGEQLSADIFRYPKVNGYTPPGKKSSWIRSVD